MQSSFDHHNEKQLNIALVGQANVGKSVVFNFLTGLHQHIGNWPGKTVTKAEGTLFFNNHLINVVDLPGVYSLTTFSIEEIITRDFILNEKPDFIINVIDGTNLERNLILTLQLLELEVPMVLAVNFVDILHKKGMIIDYATLTQMFNIPVVPIEAIYGKGIDLLLQHGINLSNHTHNQQDEQNKPSKHTLNKENDNDSKNNKDNNHHDDCFKQSVPFLTYGLEVEKELTNLTQSIVCYQETHNSLKNYPTRWLALKLLEKDEEITRLIQDPIVKTQTQLAITHLENIHGHDSSVIISAERCYKVHEITQKIAQFTRQKQVSITEKIDNIVCNKFWGYPVLLLFILITFSIVFNLGTFLSDWLDGFSPYIESTYLNLFGSGLIAKIGWSGVESFLGIIGLVIPYIVPFYLILHVLENTGYLARVAFLTDNLMHKLGVHGKACIPLLLGYGCNVSACLGCKIMETYREKFITAILATSIPCSAVTVIILGLVGKYLGLKWVLGLYLGNVIFIFILGKFLNKTLSGEATELIMAMPDYRLPHFKTAITHTWVKTKEFFYVATPLIVIVGIIIQSLYLTHSLDFIVKILNPITVSWLRLPEIVGILLIFGILRKELILVLLATVLGTNEFSHVLSNNQMLTLTIVSMLYIPCISTIVTFKHEFGWQKTILLSLGKIIFAIALAGIISRVFASIL